MTYLEIVNKVLKRLRETEVSTVSSNTYSSLIGELVNATKSEVENAWNWSALRTTLTATTSNDLFNYVLTDSGTRFRVLDVINDTTNVYMYEQPSSWFDRQFLMATVQKGSPAYYNFNGVDTNGDSQVDVFPVPDGIYDLRINVVLPQADLTSDSEIVKVPGNLIVEGVISRALSERGEDGGNQEQESRYRNMLADYISIEAGNRSDETVWYPS
jgi:hypothetical protein